MFKTRKFKKHRFGIPLRSPTFIYLRRFLDGRSLLREVERKVNALSSIIPEPTAVMLTQFKRRDFILPAFMALNYDAFITWVPINEIIRKAMYYKILSINHSPVDLLPEDRILFLKFLYKLHNESIMKLDKDTVEFIKKYIINLSPSK